MVQFKYMKSALTFLTYLFFTISGVSFLGVLVVMYQTSIKVCVFCGIESALFVVVCMVTFLMGLLFKKLSRKGN